MTKRRAGVLVTLGVLIVAACGTAEVLAPPLSVREAAKATFEQSRLSFTVSLVGSEQDIVAAFGEGGSLSPEDKKGLAVMQDSRLTFSMDRGRDTDSAEDDNVALDLKLGDIDHAVEVRMVDDALYARADVPAIARLFDAPPGAVERGVAQAAEMGFGFVADAAAGRWLSTDLTPFSSFLKGLEAGAVPGIPEVGLEGAQQLLDALADAWSSDVKVDRLDADGTGDHYRLTASLRQVYERLLPAFKGLLGFPGAALPPAGEVPDRAVEADVWVRDGKLVRAEFDLAQLADHAKISGDTPYPGGRVALRIDIAARPDAITAPEGAVKVDLIELFGRLAGGFTEGFSG